MSQSSAPNPPNAPSPSSEARSPRLPRLVLWAAVILGVLADPLLRNQPWGLGLTVWLLALALAIALLTRTAGRLLSSEGTLWLVLAVAFGSALSWRDADTVLAFDFLAMLASLTLLAMSLNGGPVRHLALARLRDLLRAAFGTGLDVATGAVPLVARDLPLDSTSTGTTGGGARRLGKALVITVPILLLFTLMLRNADPLFKAYFSFPNLQLDVLLSHVAIAAVFAWVVAGWLRGSLLGRVQWRGPVAEETGASPLPFTLGTLDVGLSLGALAVLFAAFVAVQVGWLFGGQALVLRTTGLSYAEYARRGFFELAGVAALVLPVLLASHALIPEGDTRTVRLYKRLSAVLVLLVVAIMVSAAARMNLYIHYYGISADRLYASAFMIWLAMVFAWFVLTVLRHRPRPFMLGLVASALAVLVGLNVMNPDALVARANLARANLAGAVPGGVDSSAAVQARVGAGAGAGAGIAGADPRYLARLGGDAVPALVAALTTPELASRLASEAERCAAASALLKRWTGDRYNSATAHWTQWNAARARAGRIVAAHEEALRQMACDPPPAAPVRPESR